ncbi:MAG: TetR/AcrR family transcriptional regulator [Nocardioides sp.]
MTPTTVEAAGRPRVEGEREQEILDAALAVLVEVGYDKLTMDAVAGQARASKATLYRRWSGKAALVVEALAAQKQPADHPDTGSLRGDLLAAFCGAHGLTTPESAAIFAATITALGHDEEFASAFRREIVGPKIARSRAVFERARERGELRDGLDLELVAPALAGIVLHRAFVLGQAPDQATVTAVVDQIILPAVLAPNRG